MANVRRGEVYRRKVKPEDRNDENKRRPLIVVSCDHLNGGTEVMVVPLTSKKIAERKSLSHCVHFHAREIADELQLESVALCDQIQTLKIFELDIAGRRLAVLPPEKMDEIATAIGVAVGINLEKAKDIHEEKENERLAEKAVGRAK